MMLMNEWLYWTVMACAGFVWCFTTRFYFDALQIDQSCHVCLEIDAGRSITYYGCIVVQLWLGLVGLMNCEWVGSGLISLCWVCYGYFVVVLWCRTCLCELSVGSCWDLCIADLCSRAFWYATCDLVHALGLHWIFDLCYTKYVKHGSWLIGLCTSVNRTLTRLWYGHGSDPV